MKRLAKLAFTLLLCGVLWSLVPASAEAVTLTSPNGGEIWLVGSKQKITWSPNDTTLDVILEYSTDSGWTLIYQGAGKGLYEWTVPDTPSTNARVRVKQWIKEFNYILGTDVSDAAFTISNDLSWIIIPNPPNAPADLRAIAISSNSISLSWQDKSTLESGFKVYRKYGSYDYSLIKTLAANTTSYLDDTVLPNRQYTYKVQAYNAAGFNYSSEASATTYPEMPPNAPEELKATATSSSSISLSWQDRSDNELGFKVFRKTDSDTTGILIKILDANTTSYLDTGLLPNTQYTYKVTSYNWTNFNNSNEASATTRPPGPISARTVMRFYIGSTDSYINDRLVGMDVAPVIRDGRTLVPIRYVADPLGADIIWDSATGKATIALGNNVVELWVNNNTARVNGVARLIDPLNPNVTAVTLPPGRIVLPLRFVAENLGCEVNWNATTQEVRITYITSWGGGGGIL